MFESARRIIPGPLKDVARRARNAAQTSYREATWRSRPLPDFIIIGAQKAGTTSLYSYLVQHPEIVASYRKEVHFFDGGLNPRIDTYGRGEAWYRAQFPTAGEAPTEKRFEASPLYLFHPLAAERIAALLPDVKLIALLRNPTERAISQYFHVKRDGVEPLSPLAALEAEEERLAPVLARGDYKSPVFMHNSYKRRGVYHEQLARFYRHFPRDRLLVESTEEFSSRPDAVLRRVFEFVGANPNFAVPNRTKRNVGENKEHVEPRVRAYLDEFFRPHNQALYELLGKNFGW